MKKVLMITLCLCLLLAATACAAKEPEKAPKLAPGIPEIELAIDPLKVKDSDAVVVGDTPKKELVRTELRAGDTFDSQTGLSITIESFAPSDGNNTVLIAGTVRNNTDESIALRKTAYVAVDVNGLGCEGAPREDFGMTKGIGFHGEVAANTEESLMDIFLLPGEEYMPLTVTLTFPETGEQAVWTMG